MVISVAREDCRAPEPYMSISVTTHRPDRIEKCPQYGLVAQVPPQRLRPLGAQQTCSDALVDEVNGYSRKPQAI